jgi:hypothetical protein
MQGARSVVAAEGLAGLYHGLLPTLLRDVPEIAIQFALYERLRRALAAGRRVDKLRTWEHLILGGVSGLLAVSPMLRYLCGKKGQGVLIVMQRLKLGPTPTLRYLGSKVKGVSD